MKERLIKILEQAVNKAIDFVNQLAEKNSVGQKISFTSRRDLNETLDGLYFLSTLKLLHTEDEIIIKNTFRIGQQVIFEKLLHFGNYYYSKQKLIHGDLFDKEEYLRRTNVETSSMLTRIRTFELEIDNLGGSTDDYFVERLPQLLDGISYVIDKKDESVYLPVFYNLLNLHRTIYAYRQSGHSDYLKKVESLRVRINRLIDRIKNIPVVENLLQINASIKYFYKLYLYQHSILSQTEYDNFTSEKTNENLRLSAKLRILSNLYSLDKDLFKRGYEKLFSEIENSQRLTHTDNALVISISSFYIYEFLDKTSIDLNIKSKVINTNITNHMGDIFNKLNLIQNIKIDKNDLDLLTSYNDAELRERVAKTILNVNVNELEREMKKPHGVFEISDMELRIRLDDKLVYLCMPFKTGREIKSDSVSIDVFYQILRPFFHFDNCAVVFITAKRCSQNLLNEIKRGHDKYGFSIEIIEHQQLAKLLKANHLLN